MRFGNTNKSLIKRKQGKVLSQYFAKSLASAGLARDSFTETCHQQLISNALMSHVLTNKPFYQWTTTAVTIILLTLSLVKPC